MDFSSDLIARILYCIPFSPAKLAMQGVSKRFRQAMQTRQAHAASAKVTFPLEESHSPCIPRSILKVLPYVSLGSRQTDFSWVAFLDHLQVLACSYGALRPVSPLQSVQELFLDCVNNPFCDVYEQFEHDGKLSLAWMFPNVKMLHLRGIPMDDAGDGGEQTELSFFKGIQLMSLQLMVLEDYPYDTLPVLAQKPDWARLDITIHPDIYENDPSLTDSCVPASTADVVTSITLRDLGDTEINMREFSSCSRLEHLTFQLQDDTDDDEIVQLVNLKSLTKSCRTLKFRNFIPYFLDVSESQGWRWRVRSGVGKGRWVKGRLRKRMAGRGKDMWALAVRVQ